MRRAVLLALVCLVGACRHGSTLFGTSSTPGVDPDSLYWKAIFQLDAANKRGSLDSATTYLDAYLASGTAQPHRREAMVLRQLARDARQLARVQGALQQARADSADGRPRSDAESKRREDEAVKEIQRLKDELAKANEELDRIRKRLAPKPPTGR